MDLQKDDAVYTTVPDLKPLNTWEIRGVSYHLVTNGAPLDLGQMYKIKEIS